MTTTELSNKLTIYLKEYIIERKYYSTGKLYNSIKFIITDSNSGDFLVELKSEDYIKYLDNGFFMDNFYSQDKIQNLFYTYTIEKISSIIDSYDF